MYLFFHTSWVSESHTEQLFYVLNDGGGLALDQYKDALFPVKRTLDRPFPTVMEGDLLLLLGQNPEVLEHIEGIPFNRLRDVVDRTFMMTKEVENAIGQLIGHFVILDAVHHGERHLIQSAYSDLRTVQTDIRTGS